MTESTSEAQRTDAQIIRSSLDEAVVFGEVFERHYGLVHRFLSVRVGEHTATELAAETFAIAFRNRAKYDLQRPNADPWLIGIAVNVARQEWRGRRRLGAALARLPRERADEPQSEVPARLDALDEASRIRGALSDLSRDERDLMLLYACVGMSYAEIAEALELPIGTVRSRLHRARSKLKHRLRPLLEEVRSDVG
jgi:RNA polymerase sigma-70 factor (ECF subfamily)